MKDFLENGCERVERYCHVIGENTSVVRHIAGDDRKFTCSHYDECKKNGGCKNGMCKHGNEE